MKSKVPTMVSHVMGATQACARFATDGRCCPGAGGAVGVDRAAGVGKGDCQRSPRVALSATTAPCDMGLADSGSSKKGVSDRGDLARERQGQTATLTVLPRRIGLEQAAEPDPNRFLAAPGSWGGVAGRWRNPSVH